MNQILYSKKSQKIKMTIMVIIAMLLICVLSFFVFGLVKSNSNKILAGVTVNQVDVGDKTLEEAKKILENEQNKLNNKKYDLIYKNRVVSIRGEDIELKYSNKALDDAFEYGKNGNIFENSFSAVKSLFKTNKNFKNEVNLNENKILEKVNILLEKEKATVKDDSYEISGDKIIVSKGYDGVTPKKDIIVANIINTANELEKITKIDIETNLEVAKRIDFQKIYDEVFVERKNAFYAQKEDGTLEFKKEVIGISFDKELAENSYLNIQDGENLTIELVKQFPEIVTSNLENVLFGDVLAKYTTIYNAANVSRSTNLEVSARNIDDTILLPGDIFSYNKEVGQRTADNGFKEAHIFSGGKVVDGMGGGICQVSSTLYNAVLMANLEIVERKNHMMYPQYVKQGLDATVVWGSIDFKFKNNRETPVKIKAKAKNGIVEVVIYGKKVKDEPVVELKSVIEQTIPYTTVTEYDENLEEGKKEIKQSPVNGYVSKAYQVFKDSKTGKVISEKLISTDKYRQTSEIVVIGTKKVEKPIIPEIPETNTDNSLPTGWDNPENPFYQGNN